MSLNDELQSEVKHSKDLTHVWIANWYETLDDDDKNDWDTWVSCPTTHSSAMYRVLKRRGYPFSEATFRRWVRDYCHDAI